MIYLHQKRKYERMRSESTLTVNSVRVSNPRSSFRENPCREKHTEYTPRSSSSQSSLVLYFRARYLLSTKKRPNAGDTVMQG